MAVPAKRQTAIEIDRAKMGRADTFSFNVCTYVSRAQYGRARSALNSYLNRPTEYQNYRPKIERMISQAQDLVQAIEQKRQMAESPLMTIARRKELDDRFHEDFLELQALLKRTESIHHDLQMTDVRSTSLVVQALALAVFVIVGFAFMMDLQHGMAETASVVLDDGLGAVTSWIVQKVGL